MLEGVDKVDWAAVGQHVYGKNSNIPTAIREVLSETKRENALGFLLGSDQSTGDLYDTTPHIVPFMIEILDDPSTTGKSDILNSLQAVSELRVSDDSIHSLKIKISTYRALENGIPVFIKLLKDSSIEVRQWAAMILGTMSDNAEQVMGGIVPAFASESEESVKVELVYAAGNVLSETDFREIELRRHYENWFREIVDSSPLPKVRRTAAKVSIPAAVRSVWNERLGEEDVPPHVADILVEAYLAEPQDYRIPFGERSRIVKLLAQLKDLEPLFRLLEHPDTSPDEAKWLLFILLCKHVGIDVNRKMSIYNLYELNIWPAEVQIASRKPLFERLLGIDKIWEKTTNLFSLFFGLPDSREEFRDLMEKI